MLSLKSILTESPDCISIPAMHSGSDDPSQLDLIDFHDARFTFMVYPDERDDKKQWVAFDYKRNKIISSSPGLQEDLYGARGLYSDETIDDILSGIGSFPAHSSIRSVLNLTDRYATVNDRSILDGRLFERNGNWYFPFWEMDATNVTVVLKENKALIDDFLQKIYVKPDNVFFEDERDERVFHSYDETFSSVERPTSSDEQRRMKQMQRDLHVNKGKLDKAIIQALQSRPKDVNTLYQRLEKEFGMPIVKIRHLYGAVPLDKLIAKKAKELNENSWKVGLTESDNPSCGGNIQVQKNGRILYGCYKGYRMTSLRSLIQESKDDAKSLKSAQVFFKSKLDIKELPVKVVLTSLNGDEGQLKYTHNNDVYANFVIEINSEIDVDKKIRALAHELIHVEQLHTGMLDYVKRMWNGQVFDKEIYWNPINYWKLPWESDARVRSANLWIEFNRAKRDKKL